MKIVTGVIGIASCNYNTGLVSGAVNTIHHSAIPDLPDDLSIAIPFLMESAQSQRFLQMKKDDTDTDSTKKCDYHFVQCLNHQKCTNCFGQMKEHNIDWTTLAQGTDCKTEVVKALNDKNYCMDLTRNGINSEEVDVFCNVVETCAIADAYNGNKNSSNGDDDKTKNNSTRIDCDALTSCEWDGFKSSYLGDGACNEWLPGCYNHKICGYDGGDCCKDTCKDNEYHTCGADKYQCRDPNSSHCKEFCGRTDDGNDGKDGNTSPSSCSGNETEYTLTQYSSFGNGWENATLTITKKKEEVVIYSGTMKEGASESKSICLPKEASCYSAKVVGGTWGNDLSFLIKPMSTGAREIASGGAPLKGCDFPIGSNVCERTCNGQADKDPSKDKDRQSYKELSNCIKKKCLIQLYTCNKDDMCRPCMGENPGSYCYANSDFNALVGCTLCSCMADDHSKEREEYCGSKDISDGGTSENDPTDDSTGQMPSCNSDATRKGTNAVLDYNHCSGIDVSLALTKHYDNDNFGLLDTFESCATTFKNEQFHGGKKALDCMRILVRAIEHPKDDNDPDAPTTAISHIADHLYHNGKTFCECSVKASEECPICEDFANFKTLLYESLDGCRSLDAIDCDAWGEFFPPCKYNLLKEFKKVDFSNQQQCKYIQDGCGDAGPFPSFRNLDCASEIELSAWDFYNEYDSGCLGNDTNNTPPKPAPSVTPPTTSPTKAYVPPDAKPWGSKTSSPTKTYLPPDDSKPYIPPEERKAKARGHFFRIFFIVSLIAGTGYWYYSRRPQFDYMRFRRARNHNPEDSAMYESLSTSNAGSAFQPPSLPPPPSAYGNNVA